MKWGDAITYRFSRIFALVTGDDSGGMPNMGQSLSSSTRPTSPLRMWTTFPFQQGLLSNVLNPKIAVLFTSLIPQFVTAGPGAAWESAMLAGVFALLGLIWLTACAAFASAAGQLLRRPPVKRALDAFTGTVLVGFGPRLATETR